MENNNGESGHPCLVPLHILKKSDSLPLTLTLALGSMTVVISDSSAGWMKSGDKGKLRLGTVAVSRKMRSVENRQGEKEKCANGCKTHEGK